MSKLEIEIILKKLDEMHGDIKKINEEKIPELQVQQAALKSEVKGEAKLNARVYGAIYGGVALMISLTGVAIAFFKAH